MKLLCSEMRRLALVLGALYLYIAAVKSHEAKPSAISPLYRKRVEYIPEFHDCPCYNINTTATTGELYHFFHVGT